MTTPLLAPPPENPLQLRHPLDRISTGYKKELLDTVEYAAANKPRNLQRTIGPSGIGNPCNRCLGYALAQVPQKPGDSQWLPFIGTAVHAELETIFERRNIIDPGRWLTEQRVLVGAILGEDITGSGDLFDVWYGNSIDWKIVGDRTIGTARKGTASATYITQGHTYGKGHEQAGRTVRNIMIAYLPRNARTIYEAVMKSFPYDRALADAALKRANGIATLGEQHGWHEVLSRLSRYDGCWDCRLDRQYSPDEARVMGFIA